MIRLTGFNLGAALLLGLVAWEVYTLKPWEDGGLFLGRLTRSYREDSMQSITYLLPQSRGLVFKLPPRQSILRLSTNATIRRSLAFTPQNSWRYTIRYRFLDSRGKPLKEAEYHFETRVTTHRDRTSGSIHEGWFYLNDQFIPTDPKTATLDLRGIQKDVASVNISLINKDLPLGDVAVRVYYRKKTPSYRIGHLWKRLSPKRKELSARPNVYGVDLLSEQEKRNLLTWAWQAAAPEGVSGEDYHRRLLFKVLTVRKRIVANEVFPAGVRVGPGLHGVIPLPEAGGRFRFRIESLEHGQSDDETPSLGIRWFGKGARKRSQRQFSLSGTSTVVEQTLDGGLLELESSQNIVVRPEWQSHGKWLDITPRPTYLRAYLVAPHRKLEYRVMHHQGRATPFRIELRRIVEADGSGARTGNAQCLLTALDAQRQLLRRYALRTSVIASFYDRVRIQGVALTVTDPEANYFMFEPDVASLRFDSCDSQLLVSAFSRPASLARKVRAPEDYYRYNRDAVAQRSWFMLGAETHRSLVQQGRMMSLLLQPRPPETDHDFLAGRYRWESYVPKGNWTGRYLFVPSDIDQVQKSTLYDALFVPIAVEGEQSVVFQGAPWQRSIEPRLLYFSGDRKAFRLKLFLNGKSLYSAELRGSAGEISLPALERGEAVMRVRSGKPLRLFANYIRPAVGQKTFLKRLAQRVGRKKMLFDYQKRTADDEVLSARLYLSGQTTGRAKVLVRIAGSQGINSRSTEGPHRGFTFRERIFEITRNEKQSAMVFGAQGEAVDGGTAFFIPLASDLPAGSYRIEMKVENASGGYLTLNRTISGLDEEATLRRIKRRD